MERRSFIKKSAAATGAAFVGGTLTAGQVQPSVRDIYELKIYQLTGRGSINPLQKYYENAVIPFLEKRGAKVGAFSEYSQEEPPRVYILHAYKSPEDYWNSLQEMKSDPTFLKASKSYSDLPASQPVYERYETLLMEAFAGIPQLKMPPKDRGLFELRIYESYNEDAFRRKVKMFDDEELPLFEKVGLHPLFFGELIAGSYMPALVYMLWFKDMEQREANWKKFIDSDEWDTMRVKEEYADTVSKVRKIFLTPLEFSQI
ncbi:MAG: NIPSNAP family protein [Bacteroidota bacterium]